MQLESVARRAHEFDVIHSHLDYSAIRCCEGSAPVDHDVARSSDCRSFPRCTACTGYPSGLHFGFAARASAEANYVATVLHGLPRNLLAKGSGRGGYLAFWGAFHRRRRRMRRFELRPRPVCAQDRRQGGSCRRGIFQVQGGALLSLGQVEFIARSARIRNRSCSATRPAFCSPSRARAVRLVMIEAMACGTL